MNPDNSDFSEILKKLNAISDLDTITTITPALKAFILNLEKQEKLYKSLLDTTRTALQAYADTVPTTLSMKYTEYLASSGLKTFSSVISDLNLTTSAISNMASVAEKIFEDTYTSDNTDDCIELEKSVADIVKQIDESIELPNPNKENKVQIEKSNSEVFWQVISIILTIITILQAAYYHNADAVSSAQDHAELMQEEILQTQEEKNQTDEQMKQTEILKQIEKNTDSNKSDSATKQ